MLMYGIVLTLLKMNSKVLATQLNAEIRALKF